RRAPFEARSRTLADLDFAQLSPSKSFVKTTNRGRKGSSTSARSKGGDADDPDGRDIRRAGEGRDLAAPRADGSRLPGSARGARRAFGRRPPSGRRARAGRLRPRARGRNSHLV